MKRCGRCRELKPETEFSKRGDGRPGVRSECIPCRRAYNAEYHKAHPEKTAIRTRKWRDHHPDRNAAANRKHQRSRGVRADEVRKAILRSQGGVCGWPGCAHPRNPGTRGWVADHDHTCSKHSSGGGTDVREALIANCWCVRGIVCNWCNTHPIVIADTYPCVKEGLDGEEARYFSDPPAQRFFKGLEKAAC